MTGKALSNSILRSTSMLALILSVFGCSFAGSPAFGAANRPVRSCTHENLSEACVFKVLHRSLAQSRYGDLTAGLEVKFNGAFLELARWQDAPLNDKQLKLQAAAMTAVIDAHFAGVFEGVDCFFFDPLDPSVVRRAHISIGASKTIKSSSQAQLASTCVLSREHAVGLSDLYKGQSYREILQQAPVLDGIFSAERKELSEQLTTLKANGYDVSQAMGQFFAVEDLVRTRNYENVSQALASTRQSITLAVARAKVPQWQNPNTSVASSRTEGWQR